jgi:hypothetical protein
METAVNILIMDDKKSNLKKAKEQFRGKKVNLFLAPFFSMAVNLLKKISFNLVLTDLMLPGEPEGTGNDVGKDTPYGLVLSILAKSVGVPNVAILTDVGHHDGPIPWAMDQLINLGKNQYVSVFSSGREKNWIETAKEFISIEETDTFDEIPTSTKKSLMIICDDDIEWLKEDLKDEFEIISTEENAQYDDIIDIFIRRDPNYVLLIAEVDEPRVSEELSKKKLFAKLVSIIDEDQKIVVGGVMHSSSPYYLRLPFEISDLKEKLKTS